MKRGSPTTVQPKGAPKRAGHEAGPVAPSMRAVAASLAGITAAWVAAGSTGLVAHPLRHALSWLALAVALVAAWPAEKTSWRTRLWLAAVAVVALAMTAPVMPVYNVLAAALVLAMLARAHSGLDQRVLLLAAFAATVLGVYRLASMSIPAVWLLANGLGRLLGEVAGAAAGRPLWIGATFAGLDFLVVMAALWIGWLVSTRPPRLARAVCAAAAIVCGHLVYLMLLACSTDLRGALPVPPPPPQFRDYIPPPWSWSGAVRSLLPWNVPALAGIIHLGIAAAMFRSAPWLPLSGLEKEETGAEKNQSRQAGAKTGRRPNRAADSVSWPQKAAAWAPAALAVLVPLATTLAPGQSDLGGTKIVACDEGSLDWKKPAHGQYGADSAGAYGMLPTFVATLGGRFHRSPDLSETDLADADVLMLIHPLGAWPDDRLQRVSSFVANGGSLLILAETPLREGGRASSYNDVLEHVLNPTGICVCFDTAVSETGSWQHALAPMAHPAATGIDDERNRFGIAAGPSIRLSWPARPILVGKWGWSDPGIDPVLTGEYQFDAGEQLGDLVLAAEQRSGRGTVVVLSDTSSFANLAHVTPLNPYNNLGNVNSYVFTGRLLAYLTGRAVNPQAGWRQALGLLGCAALLGLVAWPLQATRLAVVAVLLALSLAGSRAYGRLSQRVLPDGRAHPVYNNVAYIDASHLEAYSDSGWGYDGVAGLALTLMRNGYVPFLLPELTFERIQRAGMLVSIAPGRAFSYGEREAVRKFMQQGGIFIAMAGAEHAGPMQSLLDEFGLRVPRSPVPAPQTDREPKPMGAFPIRYRTDGSDRFGYVYFYTGWPIECPDFTVLLEGPGGLPVASWQQVGEGRFVLIGDTAFAMNKNLEHMGGGPFAGRYDNAHFWRWLITRSTEQEDWIPPNPDAPDLRQLPETASKAPSAPGAAQRPSGDEVAP